MLPANCRPSSHSPATDREQSYLTCRQHVLQEDGSRMSSANLGDSIAREARAALTQNLKADNSQSASSLLLHVITHS